MDNRILDIVDGNNKFKMIKEERNTIHEKTIIRNKIIKYKEDYNEKKSNRRKLEDEYASK